MRRTRARVAGMVMSALAISNVVTAAEFEPEITLGISYTDNVTLATVDEQDETIYRAEPAFTFLHETSRLSVDANYLMQALRYADIGRSEVYHRYDASLRAALIPDNFFLEVGGSRSQALVDPELNIPGSNLPLSGNRQDRDEYYVMPSFQYALGSTVTVQGQARNSWVEFSDDASREAENRDAQFSIDNYRRGRGVTWALRYDWRRSDYDDGIPWEYQQAAAEVGFWIGGATRVFATAGKESSWERPLDPALEDDFWEAGLVRQVGERLRAEFAAGERTFGSSWRGNLELMFKRGSTSISYAETPTTDARNRFRPGAFRDVVNIEDLLSRPLSQERFISKRLEWRFDFALQRTAFSLIAYDDERSQRTTAEGSPLDEEEQRGLSASVTYQLGARTDLRLRGSWAERDLRDDRESVLLRASAEADYRLGPRTTLRLQYSYAEEDPRGLGSARDYVANTVSLLLTRTF